MGYIREKSGEQRKRRKRFLVISILLSSIILQISVTICSSTALAVPHVNCVNPAPVNNGISAPPAQAILGSLVINEVLPLPESQWNCHAPNNTGFYLADEWIELYNPQNQPLDLYAAHTSIDQGPGTQSYVVPLGSIITAHGFLTVFPFMNLILNGQVQPFSLRLIISQVVIDQVSAPSLGPDISYARIPDGSNNWQITTSPTIASSNTLNSTTSSTQATKTGKTKEATSTPVHTTKSKSTNTRVSSTSNDGTNTDTAITGVQPTWSALRLPGSESNSTMINNTAQHESSTSSPSLTTSSDFPSPLNKILLTLLTAMFVFGLLWCWRLYRRNKDIRP